MAAEDKFTWKIRIKNLSWSARSEIRLPSFSFKGHQWKIRIEKKRRLGMPCFLLHPVLELADPNPAAVALGFVTDFRFTLVNRLDRSRSLKTTFIVDCSQWKRSWDFDESEIWVEHARRDGFLIDDTFIFEAQFCENLTAKVYTNLLVLRTVLNEESGLRTASTLILGDATLQGISKRMPRTKKDLLREYGIGNVRVSKYGDRILQTIASAIDDYNGTEGSGSGGNDTSDSAKRKSEPSKIEPLEAINDSTENWEPGVSKTEGAPEVIEFDTYDQFGRDSASPPLSSKVARTSTITSPSNVRSASKNLIAELSTMSSSWKPTSVDDVHVSTNDASHGASALLQEQRQKLAEFLEMSLESISQANWFDSVREVVLKMSDHATDPFEKRVLKDLLSRLVEFSISTRESLSIIDTPSMVETSSTEHLEGSLLQRQNQLKCLDSEVSRNEEDQLKVDAEIQQLLTRKDKLVRERNSALAEMEAANRDASKELAELKKKRAEHEQAKDKRLRAKERLAQNNVSWKLFKENLAV